MKTISFYSFKGGTGRTTTAANVAAELARRGKNVIVLDLDIDGPGLEIVFDVNAEVKHYIQDYIKNPDSVGLNKILFDMRTQPPFRGYSGELRLIPANLDVQAPVDASSDVVHDCIATLMTLLKASRRPQFDFCVIDSQSGYTDLSASVLDISDHLFLLCKLSKQHMMGTVAYDQFLKHLKGQGLPLESDVIVSLVAPRSSKGDEKLYNEYLEALNSGLTKPVLLEVPESPILRWTERVIVSDKRTAQDPTADAFRQIALYCLGEGRRA
jgi:MinD-like ATPase involved in chromosome partitioning or flagellar assembly